MNKISKRKAKRKRRNHLKIGVGFSLSRTTADNGCGFRADKRLKRQRTRNIQNRQAINEHPRG